jgi:hypothetical protein
MKLRQGLFKRALCKLLVSKKHVSGVLMSGFGLKLLTFDAVY